jgi:ribosomal-protein-alanine acetyltransferase
VITRRATVSDLDAIVVLENTIFPEDAWSRGMLSDAIRSEYGHFLVVELDGAIIAYAAASHLPEDDIADIQTIGVTAGARGNGVGADLFDALVSWCAGDGAKRILLEVRADNHVAQNLYQSRGFQTISIREGYYQPANVDAFVMERVVV